jgi:putative flippase GtrA
MWFDEFVRFVINGIAATAVHFTVLALCLEVLFLPSAGLANMVGALFGITVSFLGNRYFVFNSFRKGTLLGQFWRFVSLYATIAVMHGLLLYSWTDLAGFDYRIGFLFAIALQVILSYLGNRKLVFSK